MACSRQRFLSFSLRSDPSKIGRHQNQSRAAVLAHIFSDPRLPAGPPNAVTRSRRKYHSVVAHAGYSVFKVLPTCAGMAKAGHRDRRVFSESPDTVLLDDALVSLNIHCRMHPALNRWYCREAFYLTPWSISNFFAFDPAKLWQFFGLFLSFFNHEK